LWLLILLAIVLNILAVVLAGMAVVTAVGVVILVLSIAASSQLTWSGCSSRWKVGA
jgi:hypothetical protein